MVQHKIPNESTLHAAGIATLLIRHPTALPSDHPVLIIISTTQYTYADADAELASTQNPCN